MYKVTFTSDVNSVYGNVVSIADRVEPALMFALDLHRFSNVPHFVRVVDPSDSLVVELKLSEKDVK